MSTIENSKQLLERLANDDEFRKLMEEQPVQAFSQYGFDIDPQDVPSSVKIPSKDEITSRLDELSAKVEKTYGLWIFCYR